MKQTNWIRLLPAFSLLLSACQTEPSPKVAVESYLKTLTSGNPQLGQEYRCFPSQNYDDFPTGIKAWKIVGQEPKIDEKDPDSQYNAVFVSIESMSVGGFYVTRTWEATVWDSNDLFEHQKRFQDKIQQTIINGIKVTNEVNKLLGEPLSSPSPLAPPDRTQTTSKPYCITIMKKAGTD